MQTQQSDDELLNKNVDDTVGVEAEPDDPDITQIERPFNPEKIKVRTVNIVVEQLVSRIGHHEIELAPEFQRMRGIWSEGRKSRLIESLLLRIPIPVFYVSADNEDNWAVVDGVQRMSTIYDFVDGKFAFSGLEYLDDLHGLEYGELPRKMRRRINETQLIVNVIEPGTPSEVMFNIFHRINTGGMTLNGQEIRHALNPGPVRDYLWKLAKSHEFLKATANSIREERMQDRECVLRFLAFYTGPWEDYAVNDLDGYLVEAMKGINKMPQAKLDELEKIFKRSMKAAADIFEDDAFRKRTSDDDRRKPINKALFEGWSVGLARCSVRDLREVVKKRKQLRRKFMKLLRDDWEFEVSVSTSTGVPQRVKKRFEDIETLIEECI